MTGEGPRRRRRPSAYPENVNWQDTGCEIAPACLECPLPACRYDVRGGARVMLNVIRDAAIREERARGDHVNEIAARHGISPRSVFRVSR